MKIRQATTGDIKEIVELYKAGLEELGYTDWKQELLIKKVTESFVLAPCFLVVKDDMIVGMAGFTVFTIAHSGVASLQDYMFYIKPEHRNHKTLKSLVDSVKDFAVKYNFPLRVDFLVDDDLSLKQRVLKMYGFSINSVSGGYNDKVS